MRYFRQLPPVLRVASILGLLFPLTVFAMLLSLPFGWFRPFLPPFTHFSTRELALGMNLILLGGACTFVVNIYCLRFRHVAPKSTLFCSWPSQVRAMLLLAALPSYALAIALLIPVGFATPTYFLLMLLSILASVVLVVAYFWAAARTRGVG